MLISPGAVAAETGAAQIADGTCEFCEGQSSGMYLEAVNPGSRQALYVFQPADGVAHGINGHVLFVLVLNVFTIGCLEGFFPILPTGVRKPGMSADYGGKDFLFGCVRKLPIELPRQRQPIVAV
jgi:hypothetical protein